MRTSMILYRPYTRKSSEQEFTELKSLMEFPSIDHSRLRCRYYTDDDKAEFERIKELAKRDGCLRMVLINDRLCGPDNAIAVTANISEPHICCDNTVPYFVIPCKFDMDEFEFVNSELYMKHTEVKQTEVNQPEVMTPDEFERKMKHLARRASHGEEEYAHADADELMCKLLSSLGYAKGVDIFNNMNKWYA